MKTLNLKEFSTQEPAPKLPKVFAIKSTNGFLKLFNTPPSEGFIRDYITEGEIVSFESNDSRITFTLDNGDVYEGFWRAITYLS